jgi:DNA-binding LytR/AlgR family response regulator
MSFAFLRRFTYLWYGMLWSGYAALHALVLASSFPLPLPVVVFAALSYTGAFALLAILLEKVVRFGKFETMPRSQQIINYTALALIVVASGIGLTYGVVYIAFDETTFAQFASALPLQALTGTLLYIVVLQYYNRLVAQQEPNGETAPKEDPIAEEQATAASPVAAPSAATEPIDRIAIKNGAKIEIIPVSDIFYLQAYGDYVFVFTETQKYIKEQTMKYFEEGLPAHQFVRIHRSYIVNIEQISRIELHEKQTQQITLKNGKLLKVSAAGYKALRAALDL